MGPYDYNIHCDSILFQSRETLFIHERAKCWIFLLALLQCNDCHLWFILRSSQELIQKLDILASCHSFTPFISSEAINLLISSALYIGVQKSQLIVHHSPSWTLRAISNLNKNLDNEPCLHVIHILSTSYHNFPGNGSDTRSYTTNNAGLSFKWK